MSYQECEPLNPVGGGDAIFLDSSANGRIYYSGRLSRSGQFNTVDVLDWTATEDGLVQYTTTTANTSLCEIQCDGIRMHYSACNNSSPVVDSGTFYIKKGQSLKVKLGSPYASSTPDCYVYVYRLTM